MKQKGVPIPDENFDDLIAKRRVKTYFNDILWATNRGNIKIARKYQDVVKNIVNSPAVSKALYEQIATPEYRDMPEELALKKASKEATLFAEEI